MRFSCRHGHVHTLVCRRVVAAADSRRCRSYVNAVCEWWIVRNYGLDGMPKILDMGVAEDHVPFLGLSMQGIAQ